MTSHPVRVPDLPTREAVVAWADEHCPELRLTPDDITGKTGELYIDGMPANQWLDAMTMD